MDHAIVIMALLVAVALIFDFMNGFHDAANSIALMVSTRLLTPQAAVLWAAFFNVVARSEEHTSELQSQSNLVCRLLLEKKKSEALKILIEQQLVVDVV